jgi:D-alanine transaminase
LIFDIFMQLAILNDQILPLDKLNTAYLDRGLYFGDGVYEVLRSYNGKIFALDDHLERFANSLAGIEINSVDIRQVKQKILSAFEKAQIPNARIYFHITRGSALRDHNWDDNIKPNFLLTVTELPDYAPQKLKGLAVSTYPDIRWKKCWIKSLNLLPNVLARKDASRKGFDEAVFVDEKALVTEGASSSIFAVFKGSLQTAPLSANILPSITRKFVILAARNLSLPVLEKSFTAENASKADELFMAVTTKDIVPVIKFDNSEIGDARPGPITQKLISEFAKFTK